VPKRGFGKSVAYRAPDFAGFLSYVAIYKTSFFDTEWSRITPFHRSDNPVFIPCRPAQHFPALGRPARECEESGGASGRGAAPHGSRSQKVLGGSSRKRC